MVGRPSLWAGRPSLKTRSSREALPEGREWLEGPSGGPEVVGWPSLRVGRPSRKAESGCEAFLEGQEWS